MAPFLYPTPVIQGFKEKIDALSVQGDRLYVGTSTGNLHIYHAEEQQDGEEMVFTLIEVKKALTRRSIEQLGFVKHLDLNLLVVLSEESTVTLFPLPTTSPPTVLHKAKAAFSFAVHSSVQDIELETHSSVEDDFAKPKPVPMLVTQLLEAPLPHSARIISFLDHDNVCFAYSPTEYALFTISTMTAVEISTPLPITSSASAGAMGALSGLTGYMTLGLGAKPKPASVRISEKEVVISKDSQGLIIGLDAKVSRTASIEWPAPPEELAYVKPYLFSVLPPGCVDINSPEFSNLIPSTQTYPSQPNFIPTSVLQIRSSLSLLATQTIPFPFRQPSSTSSTFSGTTGPVAHATIRLLSPSPIEKAPLYLVTTPTDRAAATLDGSTIWQFKMKSWTDQLDELVIDGQYADALALLDTLDEAALPDKETRRTRIRALNAVADFREAKFDNAIDTFIELDFNPAKVVALYPEQVAGRLSVPLDGWIPLYGGPKLVDDDTVSTTSSPNDTGKAKNEERDGSDTHSQDVSATGGLLDTLTVPVAPIAESFRERIGTGLSVKMGAMIRSMPAKEELTSPPNTGSKSKRAVPDDLHRSIEALLRYLSDRRPKLGKALESVGITPKNQSHAAAPLSEASIEELFALPNVSLVVLTPEQLLRCAQIVDTALYKSYLVIRPSLLGSLCRLPNWCEVSEVEEDLRSRKKYAELVDLFNGKKMHAQALALLRELGEKEADVEDQLSPTIQYLQKLGPEHLQQIFESSRWVFATDSNLAFDIFTSEDVELPRQEVSIFLAGIDVKISARYLEFIIEERHEQTPAFHDRLAELYFSMTISAKKKGDDQARNEMYTKLLQFISSNNIYSVDRLYGTLSSTDLFEARAILLGRLGRHGQALELYVYRMHDYLKAEEYCKRVYEPGSETNGIFLTLLRLYLRPTVHISEDLLPPALDLIGRHNTRLDIVETLQLLPPLVTAQNVRAFLIEALRAPLFDTSVIRHISKARHDQLSRRLMLLQTKRVKVTDSRICPQCHKRIGNSVIAVHAPRGEVTHYQCREGFSRRLNEGRR
ncbi:Vam6/Vps39-like protein [Termitomyces sp. J132]|nr:Vam6/Vps39-like protein [Termitomyces sp. J132]